FMRTGSRVLTKGDSFPLEYYNTWVSPAYFETMGIPLRAGRPFNTTDRKGTPETVIINEAFAKRLFGGAQAVGEIIWIGDRREGPGAQIIGVAANSKHMTM